jgi:microcystin-dependent protein
MKSRRTAYLDKPTVAALNQIFADIPRQNLEEAIFDLTFQNGVLYGLDIEPAPTPNLTINISTGRGVWRNVATARAQLMENFSVSSLNLAPYLPSSGNITVYIFAEKATDNNSVAAITPVNPPVGHPAHDPLYVTTSFNPVERDSITLSVGNGLPSPTGKICLGAVVLTAGMTAIGGNEILLGVREYAGNAALIQNLQARVRDLEQRTAVQIGIVQDFAGDIAMIPSGYLLCDGSAISRTNYRELFNRLGVKHGFGDGATTFNLPNLIGKFVKGGTETTRGDVGGSNSFVLDLTHLPAHSHNITVDATVASTVSGNTANDGAHGHYNVGSRGSGGSGYLGLHIIEVDNTDDWTGTVANSVGMFSSPPPSGAALGYTTPNYSSSHQHNFSLTLPAHSHVATAASVGAGQAFDNQPAFVTLLKIIRAL